jgi:hypothetical protein
VIISAARTIVAVERTPSDLQVCSGALDHFGGRGAVRGAADSNGCSIGHGRSQRGYIEALPSGSFRAVVPAGTDRLTGRRRSLWETCKTMGEARVALTKLQRQIDQQQHP